MNQRGVSRLEWLALLGLLAILLAMIPLVRETAQELVGRVYNRVDDAGELTDFSVMMRGVTVAIAAVITFIIGLAWSISTGFAGFWGGLPFWIISIAVLGMLVYDYWDDCWRKNNSGAS